MPDAPPGAGGGRRHQAGGCAPSRRASSGRPLAGHHTTTLLCYQLGPLLFRSVAGEARRRSARVPLTCLSNTEPSRGECAWPGPMDAAGAGGAATRGSPRWNQWHQNPATGSADLPRHRGNRGPGLSLCVRWDTVFRKCHEESLSPVAGLGAVISYSAPKDTPGLFGAKRRTKCVSFCWRA